MWNHVSDHQILYDQKLQRQLKQPLELTIFDDNQPINGKDDLVGTAQYIYNQNIILGSI